MGTSGSSTGPGSDSPLVPSWLADEPVRPLPGGDDDALSADGAEGGPGEVDAGEVPGVPATLPPIPPIPSPARFQSARRNFSAFARSGGTDGSALRRAARDYVRSGAGSSRNATRRMGASRSTAGGVLGVFRGFQRDGKDATLRRLNLGDLVGRSAVELFLGLTDVICPDGGPIDEGMARDAWLETVADLDELGLDDTATLADGQIKDIFLAFVAHSIEARLFQDIGVNGLKIAADLAAIESFEAEFRSYIRRSVRDSFSGDLSGLATLSDRQITTIVDQTYEEAWDLLVTWGDAEV